MLSKLTQDETDRASFIMNAGSDQFAIVRTSLDGEETAAIAFVDTEAEGYNVIPLAILVTEKMFDRLANPAEGLPE